MPHVRDDAETRRTMRDAIAHHGRSIAITPNRVQRAFCDEVKRRYDARFLPLIFDASRRHARQSSMPRSLSFTAVSSRRPPS